MLNRFYFSEEQINFKVDNLEKTPLKKRFRLKRLTFHIIPFVCNDI